MKRPWKMRVPTPERYPRYRVVNADGAVIAELPIQSFPGARELADMITKLPQLAKACDAVVTAGSAEVEATAKADLRAVLVHFSQVLL